MFISLTGRLLSPRSVGAALAQRGVEYIREQAARLPLDLTSDADPARDKALADSVRGGFVDDVGVEENRRVFDVGPKSKVE